jgi:hypothetical protein
MSFRIVGTRVPVAALLLACSLAVALPAVAADDGLPDPEAATGDAELDALLVKEKEARKACKIQICGILRSKKVEGPDVECDIVQTWPKKALNQLIAKARVEWPMGNALCTMKLKLKRSDLAKAMSEPKFESEFGEQNLVCDIAAAEKGGEPTTIKLSVKPKVTFENGVATDGSFNWGPVEAPAVAKGVIWPAVKLDNTFGLFGGTFVKMVNRFTTAKCDEVKDDLPKE